MDERQKLRIEDARLKAVLACRNERHPDEEFLRAWEGYLVRKLPPDQLEYFRILERLGRARRSYEGLAGLVGYARVRRP